MPRDELRIHPAAKAIPEMLPDEFATLKADIQSRGLLVPIKTLDGRLLDGRHRFKACKELGIEANLVAVDLDGMTPAEYVWSVNGIRRHLTPSQKAAVAVELLPELKKASKKRQKHHGGTAPGRQKDTSGKNSGSDSGESRDHAAAMVNVNPRYISDAAKLKQESPEEFLMVKCGTKTLAKAIQDNRRDANKATLNSIATQQAKTIKGVYDVIVIDPPWPMNKIERDVRPNQSTFDYPTMSESEIAAINVPCDTNCHVWLWTTHKFLPMSFRLLDAWGLKYVCTFVWHKPGGFQPVGLPQYNCEFVLYARRGSPTFLDTKSLPTCFAAKRTKHSEKPEEFYDVIRRVTGGRRLDMFNRRAIEGFDSWGNEA